MPLPIAHGAVGLAVYFVWGQNKLEKSPRVKKVTLALLLVVLSIAPDLDFIPGLLLDEPNKFHHGISHSLIIALIGAVALFLLLRKYYIELETFRLFIVLLVVLGSHTILDIFSVDTSSPFGVPLLWPFSQEYFISPYSLFPDVIRSKESTSAFITSLWNTHNLQAAGLEVLFACAVLLMVLAKQWSSVKWKFWLFTGLSFTCIPLFMLLGMAVI